MLTEDMLAAYLVRIGVPGPLVLDAEALRGLHRAHLVAVPFENLSIHLGEPISLNEADLVDKIVARRRGGFCYELNGAFACLLERLGAEVRRVAARVYGEDGTPGPPFDHLALMVRLPDGTGPWLADVGFGSHSTYPLLAGARSGQADPGGQFLLTGRPDGDIDVAKDGRPQYRIEPRERALDDFVPTCWWQQTSPRSHFTRSVICSRLTGDGRVSISGRTLIRTAAGQRTEENLPDDRAVLAAYRDHFGINLNSVPELAGRHDRAPWRSLCQGIPEGIPRFLAEHAVHGHARRDGQRRPVGDGLGAGAAIGRAHDTVGVDEAVEE